MRTAKSLPGILHWCEITDMKIETLEPIIVAVDTLTKKNSDMRATVQVYRFVVLTYYVTELALL